MLFNYSGADVIAVFNTRVIDPAMKRLDEMLKSHHRENLRIERERVELLRDILEELKAQRGQGKGLR